MTIPLQMLLLGKRSIQDDTLHPEGRKGLESIQNLEDSLTRAPDAPLDDTTGQPPVFTSQFVNLKDLNEGDIAHFEATLTPVGDQTMQVEWFFRGKPLKAGKSYSIFPFFEQTYGRHSFSYNMRGVVRRYFYDGSHILL